MACLFLLALHYTAFDFRVGLGSEVGCVRLNTKNALFAILVDWTFDIVPLYP
jgi:hypothetical protein